MIRGRCPICSKAYEVQKIDDLPGFPFCSERCRLIDLGRWVDGAYAIPAAPSTDHGEEDSAPAEDPDEE